MAMLNHIQNILPVFGAPTIEIFLLRIGGQINKTTFATTQTGKLSMS